MVRLGSRTYRHGDIVGRVEARNPTDEIMVYYHLEMVLPLCVIFIGIHYNKCFLNSVIIFVL